MNWGSKMVKSLRLLVAALMLSGVIGLSSGAKAAEDGIVLTTPTTIPVVGDLIGVLLGASGGAGGLFLESGFPSIDAVLGILDGGLAGPVAVVPLLELAEPALGPVLNLTAPLGVPLLDPNALGGSDSFAGLPLFSAGGIIQVGSLDQIPLVPVVGGLVFGLTGGGPLGADPANGLLGTLNGGLLGTLLAL